MIHYYDMMKAIRNISLALLLLGALASCKSKYELLLASADIPTKYTEAFNLFEKGKYKKSAAMFESLSMLTTGMAMDDTVRYYWALSNYKYEDYVTAEANFTSFLEFYPRGPFSSDAQFLRLECKFRATYRYELDQNPTNLAIVAISEYMMEFPESDKLDICEKMLKDLGARLDRKAYENALLYYKMEDYIAAKTAFRNLLKDDADNIFREEVLYYIAKSNYKYAQLSVPSKQKERYMDFIDSYLNFISEYENSNYRKDMDHLYAKADEFVNGRGAKTKKELRRQQKEERELDKEVERLNKSRKEGTEGSENVKKMKLVGAGDVK